MATLHRALVDKDGTTLAYIDSGPPPSDIYTTVVLVHGLSYNSQTFIRLFPLAASYNLRIIAINRRDYTGSTPLTDADLALLFSKEAENSIKFLRERGAEIAHFLSWIIDELKIPAAQSKPEGGWSGGLTLLGWSLGSITTLAFLRHLSCFPREIVDKLSSYLKTFVIYDSGYTTLGYPHPPGMYHPLHDSSIPASDRRAAFNAWISSYYFHPFYASSVSPQALRTLEQLTLRVAPVKPKTNTDSADASNFRPPSYANIEPEAFAAAIETFSERSERAFVGTVRSETLYDLLAGALFFSAPHSVVSSALALPNEARQFDQLNKLIPLLDLQVLYVYGTSSPWTTQWCSWQLEADKEAHSGGPRRPLRLVRIEGGNHFLHWDHPDKFLSLLSGNTAPRDNASDQ